MKKSLKKLALGTLVGISFALVGCGGGEIASSTIDNGSSPTDSGNTSSTTPNNGSTTSSTTSSSEEEWSNKEKFLGKLITPSSIKFSSFNVSIDGLDQDQTLSISSPDLAINLLGEDATGSAMKASGTLNLAYGEVANEQVGLYVSGDRATINHDDILYYIDFDSISDIFNIISDDDFPKPSADGDEITIPSNEELLDWLGTAIENMSEEESEDGENIKFTLDFEDNGKLTFLADKETYAFKGIETPENSPLSLSVNGTDLQVTISSSATQNFDESQTSDIPTDMDSNDLNGVTGIFKTVLNLTKAKAFDSTLNAKLTGEDGEDNLSLRLSGDFSTDDYVAQIEALSSTMLKGSAMLTYSGKKTYVNANGKIKGAISNTTVSDLISLFGSETDSSGITSIIEKVLESFQDTPVENILNGDYSVYDQFIDSLTSSDDGKTLTIAINSKSLGLADDDSVFTLSIYLNDDKSGVSALAIKDLPVSEKKLDLSLSIDSMTGEGIVEINKDEYGNYDGISPIISDIYKIYQNKKVGLSYNIGVSSAGLKDPVDISGLLMADASQVTGTDDLNSVPFALTASTTVEGVKHTVIGRKLDSNYYLSYDNVMKQKMSESEGESIYNSVMDGIKKFQSEENSDEFSKSMEEAMNVLSSLVTKTDGLDLEKLTDIFSIDNSICDDNTIRLIIDTSKLGLEYGTISLILGQDENEVLSLNATGLTMGDTTLSINIKTVDYIEPNQALFDTDAFDPESYIEVTKFENFTNGLFDIIHNADKKQYGIELKANLIGSAEGAYTEHLYGLAYFDVPNGSYKGQITYDMDKYDYDPSVEFSYDETTDEQGTKNGVLMASYGHMNSAFDNAGNYVPTADGDKLYVKMNSSSIDEIIDSVNNMSQDNLLYDYYTDINDAASTIPFEQIIEDKDYTKYLNDFVRSIKLTDSDITVGLNPYYLGMNDLLENDELLSLTVTYDETGLTGMKADGVKLGNKELNIEANLIGYDETNTTQMAVADFSSVETYLDFDTLPLLVTLGLNTTDKTTFSLKGALNISVLDQDMDTTIEAVSILVEPGENGEKTSVSGYIKLSADSTVTEYFIRPETEDCLIINQNGDAINMILVDQEEIIKHFAWYVIGWGMNFNVESSGIFGEQLSDLMGYAKRTTVYEIDKAMSSSDGPSEETIRGGIANSGVTVEKLISSYTYDETSKAFTFSFDLSAVNINVSGMSLGDNLTLNIYHDTNAETGKDEISKVTLSGNVLTIVSILNMTADFTCETTAFVDFSSRMDAAIALYNTKSNNSTTYYTISSIEKKEEKVGTVKKKYYLSVTSATGEMYSLTTEELNALAALA